MTRTMPEPVGDENKVVGIAFASTITTVGMADQQLVYQVRILDTNEKPILAKTHRYRNAAGELAGVTTVMVLRSPWTFDDVRVTLPAEAISADAKDMPLYAEFGVYKANGERIARQLTTLPLKAARTADGQSELRWVRGETPQRVARASAPRTAAPPAAATAARPASKPAAAAPPTASKPVAAAAAKPPAAGQRPATPEQRDRSKETAAAPPAKASTDRSPAPASRPQAAPPRSASSAPASQPGTPPRGAETPPRGSQDRKAPTTQPAKTAAGATTIYVAQKGDTLETIAGRLLKDPKRWVEIYELNRDQLSSPGSLAPGMKLRVPANTAASKPGEHG